LSYPKEVFLLSGDRQTIRVQVQRQDYQGPVHLALEGLPASLKFAPVDIPAGQTTAILEVSSTADAKDWAGNIELTAHVGSIRVWSSSLEALVVKPTALRLLPIPDVALSPGESQKIRAGVDRRGYTGAIVIQMDDLPNGVTCKPVTLMGADGLAILEVVAGREVAPVDTPITVAMYLGGKKFTTQTAKLTIGKLLSQPVSRESVRFTSVDGVRLCGTWYKSAKGKDAPCVLLLHNIGGHRKQEGWDALARLFQEKGYAVLSFDFRGHGDSTAVDDNFWLHPVNRNGVRGSATAAKEAVRLAEFTPGYYPILANDIAAARMFLDRQNDEGKCNSANLLLVGAHEGATLGALWLCAECCRYPAINLKPVKLDRDPEGKHVAGAVWLNVSPTLADRHVPLFDWLRLTGRDRRVPTTFVRGGDDPEAATVTTPLAQELLRPAPLTEIVIPKTKLTGHALLKQELGTEGAILAFCDQVVKEKPASPWTSRDVDRKIYYWSIPPATNLLIAKQRGEKALHLLPLAALGIR
jgi:pimeloyl-ACP methyl ester carboxylesterase